MSLNAWFLFFRIQNAYCLQSLGNEKEAQTEYTEVLKYKPKDIGSVAIASNNLVVLNREHNVFDSKKKLKSTLSDELTQKLTTSQLKTIYLNHCRFAVITNQVKIIINFLEIQQFSFFQMV